MGCKVTAHPSVVEKGIIVETIDASIPGLKSLCCALFDTILHEAGYNHETLIISYLLNRLFKIARLEPEHDMLLYSTSLLKKSMKNPTNTHTKFVPNFCKMGYTTSLQFQHHQFRDRRRRMPLNLHTNLESFIYSFQKLQWGSCSKSGLNWATAGSESSTDNYTMNFAIRANYDKKIQHFRKGNCVLNPWKDS